VLKKLARKYYKGNGTTVSRQSHSHAVYVYNFTTISIPFETAVLRPSYSPKENY